MTGAVLALVVEYNRAFGDGRLDRVREMLHPDLEFRGTARPTNGVDEYMAGLPKLVSVLVRNDLKEVIVEGNRAFILYDFVTDTTAGAVLSGELLTFQDGLIRNITLLFDLRHWPEVIAEVTRRNSPVAATAEAKAPGEQPIEPRPAAITSLGARVHLFVRPEARDRFTDLFRDVLACDVVEHDFGLPHPILFVGLGDGSGFSVEFSDLAPPASPGPVLDDASAFRGPWIEFRTADLAGTQQRLRDAGIPEFRHPGSSHAYFSAPGGQVFRLLDVTYVGP